MYGGFCVTGNNLSSQAASSPVLSTRESLTAVFGMGTGGASQPSSPDLNGLFRLLPRQPAARPVDIPWYYLPSLTWPSLHKTGKSSSICFRSFSGPQNFTEETTHILHLSFPLSNQALDGLVPVRSIHCCTYTPGLSTLSSPRRLTDLCHERSHLGVGFTLRCFQRLSLPDVATQRYAWRHNWYTIGPSTPVLSY